MSDDGDRSKTNALRKKAHCHDMRELRDKVARHYGRQVVQFALSLPTPKQADVETTTTLPPFDRRGL
jgi:hypothetical protein